MASWGLWNQTTDWRRPFPLATALRTAPGDSWTCWGKLTVTQGRYRAETHVAMFICGGREGGGRRSAPVVWHIAAYNVSLSVRALRRWLLMCGVELQGQGCCDRATTAINRRVRRTMTRLVRPFSFIFIRQTGSVMYKNKQENKQLQ